jgi:hypothetical protein
MAIDLQDFIRAIVHHDIACRSPSISRHKNTPGILKTQDGGSSRLDKI